MTWLTIHNPLTMYHVTLKDGLDSLRDGVKNSPIADTKSPVLYKMIVRLTKLVTNYFDQPLLTT